MINYVNGKIFVEKASLEKLCRTYGSPLFVYSKAQLLENYRKFDSAFSSVPHLTCFAVKSNSNSSILRILVSEGAGADITSGGELYRTLRAGFVPQKIVYAGIGKATDEIEYALKSNILMFNVESIEELENINRIALKLKKKAKIAFRVNPNVDPHTHKYITTGKNGSKFGIPYKEALEAYQHAMHLKAIDPAGVHCHIGSQITIVKPFRLAAEKINSLVKKLVVAGIDLRYVNLGGGLGITYNKEIPPHPSDLSRAVLPVFKDFKGTFIFEPGRCIVGNTGIFAVQVIYRKKSGGKNFLIVNGGMNDLVRPTLYDAYHDIVPVRKSFGKKVKVDVVGPICETGDFLGKGRMLPWVEQGGTLAVKCAGAYGMAMSSQYNSRLRAAEILVNGKNVEVIRDREKYDNLIEQENKKGK